jgi:para-aminobenzoate synthetase component I
VPYPAPIDVHAVLAQLDRDLDVAVVRDGPTTVLAVAPSMVLVADGAEALGALDGLRDGWWAGWLDYDLGRAIEPIASARPRPAARPDVVLARFDARIVWAPGRRPEVVGDGPARPLLRAALARAGSSAPIDLRTALAATPPSPPRWTSSFDRAGWCAAVRTVQEHILAGDCYQVNVTRRLHTSTPLDARTLFSRLGVVNPAPHAALVQVAGRAVVSASPERFLAVEPTPAGRGVETRPIKGTAADGPTLLASEKDRAENVMIVDLARNDLGRVCVPGSIVVPGLCELEEHPGLVHLVSTVRGVLRPDVGWGGLVAATFPPASVTGAPKPRVLQIIDDLEPVGRGTYCGAVGWIDVDAGRADLNVAIRTFELDGDGVDLGVGAGIVADSSAEAEWRETELKAARLLAAAGACDTAHGVVSPRAPSGVGAVR